MTGPRGVSAPTQLTAEGIPSYNEGTMRPGSFTIAACAALLAASLGCSSNLAGFDVVDSTPVEHPLDVKKAETADQGAGIASSPAHRLRRTTVGGTYLRRPATGDSGGLRAGVNATPEN